MDASDLAGRLAAIAHVARLRILAALAEGPTHVSELARRVGMSRALLYVHLRRLEEMGYVTGHLELSADGKALKFFEVMPFNLTIDLPTVIVAVANTPAVDVEPESES